MAETSANDLKRGPVHAEHERAGATFAPFGGWLMPVSYSGTVAEHKATRSTCGLFDVSHLGKARVRGANAARFVNSCLTNDLDSIAAGQAQYTLCLDDEGGTVDDLFSYRVSDEEIFLIPNAANNAEVVKRLQDAAADSNFDVKVENCHADFAVFAVQGPRSPEVLKALGLPTEMDFAHFEDAEFDGAPVRVCRTGYTGEHGYELLPRAAEAAQLWCALEKEVLKQEGALAGLGARDSLRLECGYPLHGHEISTEMSPLWARCSWAIGWDKPEFWGRDAVLQEKQAGPKYRMYALTVVGRGVLRADQEVRVEGRPVGRTTSGTFSPTLGTGIALALISTDAGVRKGDHVTVDVRGRDLECEVRVPPLVEIRTR